MKYKNDMTRVRNRLVLEENRIQSLRTDLQRVRVAMDEWERKYTDAQQEIETLRNQLAITRFFTVECHLKCDKS